MTTTKLIIEAEKKDVTPLGTNVVAINELAALHKHAMPIDTKSYEALQKSRGVLRELRLSVEEKHKELKKPILEAGKALDAEKNKLVMLITSHELPLQQLHDAYKEKKAAEKKAKEEAEARRIAAIQEKINSWSAYLSGIHNKNAEKLRADLEFFEECCASDNFEYEGYEAQADAIKQSTKKALSEAFAERQKFEEEEAKVAAERAALEKERQELEEKRRIQEEELRKIREAEEAKLAAERAAQEAEATRLRDEENARLAKQYEELERQKAAAKEAEEKKAKELAEEIAKIEAEKKLAAEKEEAERLAKIKAEEEARKIAQDKEDRVRKYAPQMLDMLKAVVEDSHSGKAVNLAAISSFISEVEGG